MKIKKILLYSVVRFIGDIFVAMLIIVFVVQNYSAHGDLAGAESFPSDANGTASSYPYTKTFTISAYYSPLPCQSFYTTGSYDGDIRLNGGGVRGADGTAVYPGMIAAPKSYAFGTKMDIPGVGIVSVHDRGGAIVASNTEGRYDRLDVWMGYGDVGLRRALNWGKRNLDVIVHGSNESLQDQIILAGYTPDESAANSCTSTPNVPQIVTPTVKPVVVSTASVVVEKEKVAEDIVTTTPGLLKDLSPGDSGEDVTALQKELKKMNYFRTSISGYYGPVTEHAIFKFQQSQRLAGDKNSLGAGVFGPKTRDRLNEIVVSRNFTTIKVAEASNNYKQSLVADKVKIISTELAMGSVGQEVSDLQKFLKTRGYFEGAIITDYFGPVTQKAVLDFQISNNLIKSQYDTGAGRVGPSTLEFINNLG